MLATSARGTTERLNLFLEQLITDRRLTFGRLDVSSESFCSVNLFSPETQALTNWWKS